MARKKRAAEEAASAVEQARASKAFALEQQIKDSMGQVHETWWTLSEHLYNFHEAGYWVDLGYGTLDEFLAQPDLGISRTHFFAMTRMYRDLVVTREIPVSRLQEIEPSKVREVRPAIMRGDVSIDDALDDAEELGYRDIREKYRPEAQAKHGQKPDDSTPLAAEDEIVRVQCEHCKSWYVPDEVPA